MKRTLLLLVIPFLSFAQLTKTGFRHSNPNLYVDFSGKIGSGKGLERFGKKTITFVCGNSITIVHTTVNGVAPVNKTVTYGTVSSSLSGSQKCWITQNLGSTNQAISETDASEAAAGWYWQFNKKKGYKNNGTSTTPSFPTTNTNTETTNWEAAKDPCTLELGAGWRIPTVTEWTNVNNANLRAQAYAGPLKMHAAGFISTGSTTSLTDRGSKFFYWSSTSSDVTYAKGLVIYTTQTYNQISNNDKDAGLSVRCIRD
ncbi:hypothetical protein U8695_05935 [Aquirufa antheringensis]